MESLFLACDKDGDGRLSFTELISFCDSIQTSVPPAILAGKLVESDYSAKLSLSDVKSRLKHFQFPYSFTGLQENEEASGRLADLTCFSGTSGLSTPLLISGVKRSSQSELSQSPNVHLSETFRKFHKKHSTKAEVTGSSASFYLGQSPKLPRVSAENSLKKTISMLSLRSKRGTGGKLANQTFVESQRSLFSKLSLANSKSRDLKQSMPDLLHKEKIHLCSIPTSERSSGLALDMEFESSGSNNITAGYPSGEQSFVEILVLESCHKLFRSQLDFHSSQLNEEQEKEILKHVICQLSPETGADLAALNQVVEQVFNLVGSEDVSGERKNTPQVLASRLAVVAQSYQQNEEETQVSRSSSWGKEKRVMGGSLLQSNYSSEVVLTSDQFTPFNNEISSMNVLTGSTLDMANIDPKLLQEAQVSKDMNTLERKVAKCLQKISEEGIEMHPMAALALYLFQLINDFSKEEIEDLRNDLCIQAQMLRDHAEQLQHSQTDFDNQLERLIAQQETQLKQMQLAHEKTVETLSYQFEKEKFQMSCDHKHEMLKLRIHLERLDAKNSSLKSKLFEYEKEMKQQTSTICKLEKEAKHLTYQRSVLEQQVNLRQSDADEALMPKISALHSLLRFDGPQDNLLTSPASTLKWETVSGESEECDCLSEETDSARNCKGSSVYLYFDHEAQQSDLCSENQRCSYEVDENVNEEHGSISAICCSLIQLTRSFGNTKKKKTHRHNQEKQHSRQSKQRSFTSTLTKRISSRNK